MIRALTTLIIALFTAGPALAQGCIWDLNGTRYITQTDGSNVRLNLTQNGTALNGRADWMDDNWVRVINTATVSGELDFDRVTMNFVWQNPARERRATYMGERERGRFTGLISVPGQQLHTTPRWSFATDLRCIAPRIARPMMRVVNAAPHQGSVWLYQLAFSVQTNLPVQGEFIVRWADATVGRGNAIRTPTGYRGVIQAQSYPGRRLQGCFAPQGAAPVCADPVTLIDTSDPDFRARARATQF